MAAWRTRRDGTIAHFPRLAGMSTPPPPDDAAFPASSSRADSASPRELDLALQGGGAHGAFTWGVLDRLLEEPDLRVESISGASAGAMNAVALAHGWALGGATGARRALEDFWSAVGDCAAIAQWPHDLQTTAPWLPSPGRFMLGWTRFFSPAQFNPLDVNPLRALVTRHFDFERLRAVEGDLQGVNQGVVVARVSAGRAGAVGREAKDARGGVQVDQTLLVLVAQLIGLDALEAGPLTVLIHDPAGGRVEIEVEWQRRQELALLKGLEARHARHPCTAAARALPPARAKRPNRGQAGG